MKIAWSVKLPKGAKLKIKNGDRVEAGEVIYEFYENIVQRLPLVGWQNLGSGDRKLILQNIIKRNIDNGEILKNKSWWSQLVIKSPGSGKCLGVDEFGNIELENIKDEKYKAPVSSNKIRIENEKIIFELKGCEFEGEGINQFKSWSIFEGIVVEDSSQINSGCANQIIIVRNSLESVIKAEAIGVTGLILVGFDKFREFDDFDIPIISMKDEDLIKLIKFVDGNQVKIWLNASAGKVLVVLE